MFVRRTCTCTTHVRINRRLRRKHGSSSQGSRSLQSTPPQTPCTAQRLQRRSRVHGALPLAHAWVSDDLQLNAALFSVRNEEYSDGVLVSRRGHRLRQCCSLVLNVQLRCGVQAPGEVALQARLAVESLIAFGSGNNQKSEVANGIRFAGLSEWSRAKCGLRPLQGTWRRHLAAMQYSQLARVENSVYQIMRGLNVTQLSRTVTPDTSQRTQPPRGRPLKAPLAGIPACIHSSPAQN